MKIRLQSNSGGSQHKQGFVAVIVMVALMGIMLIYVAANGKSLSHLKQNIRLTETKQLARLAKITVPAVSFPTSTNAPSITSTNSIP